MAGELERLEQKLFDDDWAEATTRLGREPRMAELARTPDQRRADALVEMARRSASLPPEPRRPGPLGAPTSRPRRHGRPERQRAGRVSAAAFLRSEPSALAHPLEGGSSRVIDVSRRRSFTGALRRLIEVRDRLCYHDYCEEPAHRCQVDHVVAWAAGGMTEQGNGRLACGYHNRLRHRRGPPAA